MQISENTESEKSYALTMRAMSMYVMQWLALAIFVIAIAITLIFRFSPIDNSNQIFYAVFGVLLVVGYRRQWRMAWKVVINDHGLTFFKLFGRQFVPWTSVIDIDNRAWGQYSFYVVSIRNEGDVAFYDGMQNQDDLLQSIRQKVPRTVSAAEREFQLGRISMFRQGFMLVSSIMGMFLGTTVVVLSMRASKIPDLSGLLFLLLATIIAAAIAVRARSVGVTTRGLTVKTWIRQFTVPWDDVQSIKQIPVDRSLAIRSRAGWCILGSELSHFHDLKQALSENTKLQTDDKPKRLSN